jgi:hypothetical protein
VAGGWESGSGFATNGLALDKPTVIRRSSH